MAARWCCKPCADVVYVGIATAIHSAIVALAGPLQATVATATAAATIRLRARLALVGIAIWFPASTGR